MLKITITILALAVIAGPTFAKDQSPKKGRSFEECHKRAVALGLKGQGNSDPSPNCKSFMCQCMRGEV